MLSACQAFNLYGGWIDSTISFIVYPSASAQVVVGRARHCVGRRYVVAHCRSKSSLGVQHQNVVDGGLTEPVSPDRLPESVASGGSGLHFVSVFKYNFIYPPRTYHELLNCHKLYGRWLLNCIPERTKIRDTHKARMSFYRESPSQCRRTRRVYNNFKLLLSLRLFLS